MAKEKPSVFINYRRALCTKEARLLYLMLDARFPGALFQDEATLKAGDEWLPKIRESIESAKVMLVLIPPRWVSYAVDLDFYTKNPDCIHDGLIHRPNDIVRMEIEAGLKTEGLTIIPILLNGAQKPLDNQMPASIRPLFEKFNIANKGQALDFSQPDIDQFKALFAQIAEKAGIEQQVDAHDNIFQPTLKKEYPLDDELLPEAESPFIGLKPFKREHARLFFGRNREIFNLCFKLFEAPKPRLLLLDGYSGTGKSSLLQAGLIPRIEAQRWGWAYGRREDDPVNGLRGVFDGLLEKLKKEGNGKSVLILDQVEEAVTDKIEGLPDELEAFAAALQAAFGEHPGYKFIIGFRSEQATRIKKILNDHRIPFDDENTLFPLDRVGAAEAISGGR
ncbi:MAG: toll/interleukin-1 receptor domain-containing protein [Lewinellaceae bacterium]|nr:toll/interleukin-1 receptor domain-containing protein [Lewinellaceae bacterium]